MLSKPTISLVIPLYNEEEVFPLLIKRIENFISEFKFTVEVVLVDDGSMDSTSRMMMSLGLEDDKYKCVFLSRNHGHQKALTAGLTHARATKAIAIMDGDLQDPPELIPEMYNKFLEGNDVVYAVRNKRKENVLKRCSYWIFYRLLNSIAEFKFPLDSGDFCLISRRVVDILNHMPEEDRYIRGMRSWVGFKQTGIEYDRDPRTIGNSKYNLRKLIKLAHSGIFNFSNLPLKLITYTGFSITVIVLIYAIITIYKKYYLGNVPQGFTAIIVIILLVSGVQLLSIGILGEYISRVFSEVKNRPLFIVKSIIEDKEYKEL